MAKEKADKEKITAADVINRIRAEQVLVPEGSTLLAVLIGPEMDVQFAGDATPQMLKAIGMCFVEMAVKAEIKAAL